jgi:secreted Zn-dependent insulinase-like peptidase
VQSTSHNHHQLEQRIKAFLNDFSKQLVTLLAKQLAATKQAILQQLHEPDTNLRIRSQRLWTSVMQDDWQFNRLAALASAIEHWQADDLLAFWQHWQQSELAQCFVHAVPTTSSN